MTPFEPEALKLIEACRNHAQDLYRAAAVLKEQGLPNVAYHLATLALEELGKAQLIGMRSMSKRDDADAWYDKQLEDHVKKLFWALWGRVFGRRPDRKEIDSLRGLATMIHGNRLRGLYVSADAAQFVTPKEAVGEDLLAPLMSLVEARLGMEPPLTGVEYEPKDLELLNWFSAASDDPEKRRFIFSRESFDRMEAFGGREWITWLKTELEAAAVTVMASLEKEMKRGQPEESEAQQDKWQLKIRLFSQSHSIRGKDLNQWNERVTWLKLYPVDNKKDQILVEVRPTKIVSLVAYLAKTDVFLQFEIQAYGAFLASLAAALRIYRADLGSDFAVAFSQIMAELTADEAFQKKHADLITSYNTHSLALGAITLREVVEMKRICDAAFMRIFAQVAQERAQQGPDSGD